MNKLFFFCLVSLTSFSLFAQKQYLFQLLAAQEKKPIAYATIWLQTQKMGAYTNENGFFELYLQQHDTIYISAIGYEKLQFVFIEGNTPTTFYLKLRVNDLPIVTVTPNKKLVDVGFFNEKSRKKDLQYITPVVTWQTAVFIPNNQPSQQCYIQSINLHVKKGTYHQGVYKVHLYTKDSNGMPYEEILPKEVVFRSEQISNKNTILLDILTLNIRFPQNGIFVAVELLGFIDGKTGLVISGQKQSTKDLSQTPIFKSNTATGYIMTATNESYEKWGMVGSWSIPDYKKMAFGNKPMGQGLKPAIGLTLVLAE